MSQDDSVHAKLDSLQESVDTLGRGLSILAATLATHSEMLRNVLEACAVETGGSDLAGVLEEIADGINHQNETLVEIGSSLERIGPTIELSVIRGVARATGTVDDDGVVQE